MTVPPILALLFIIPLRPFKLFRESNQLKKLLTIIISEPTCVHTCPDLVGLIGYPYTYGVQIVFLPVPAGAFVVVDAEVLAVVAGVVAAVDALFTAADSVTQGANERHSNRCVSIISSTQ